MLFDPGYFISVAEHFPQVTFHVIGCGINFPAPQNVLVYPEMKFQDTLPYLKHATIGVAPYRAGVGVEYLAESSLKLAQYEYLGLPAVCSDFAAGKRPSRFGYETENVRSMIEATSNALSAVGKTERREFPTWEEVGLCLLHPEKYEQASIL
jgi:2-beta-glucuronyltransferase